MSYRMYGCHADVILWAEIAKLCPKETALIDLALIEFEVSKTNWIRGLRYEDMNEYLDAELTDEQFETLESLFPLLNTAFEKATAVGESHLSLEAVQDSDTGEEEIDDGCFAVYGAYVLSPAGKKFEEKFHRVNYVIGG